jgi:serine protease Do
VGDGSFEDFLQTDAPINQGNSGGALVDTQGRLVGINSQILSPSGGNIGIGFAIPSNMAESVMSQLEHGGHVRRAQLGVTVQGVTSDLAESLGLQGVRGALVSDVSKDSPGERAGLQRGDVIVSVDGHAVDDSNALRNRIAGTPPGTSVSLGIVRDGHPQTLHAQLAELHSAQAGTDVTGGSGEHGRLGLAVRPVTPDEAAQLHLDSKSGLVVAQVDPAGPAADSGIRPGDVIEQVNRRPVNDVGQLKAAVAASSGRPVLLLVNRDGQSIFLTVEPPRA